MGFLKHWDALLNHVRDAITKGESGLVVVT